MVPIYFIAIKTNWLQTCILARVLLQREWRVHIETESDRRQQGDGGKERAGRSQEVGKENEMGGGGVNNRWQLPHVWISVSPLRAMLPCWEAGKRRETEKEGHRKQWQVSPCLSLSPLAFHTVHRQRASHHHGQQAMLFIHLWLLFFYYYYYSRWELVKNNYDITIHLKTNWICSDIARCCHQDSS